MAAGLYPPLNLLKSLGPQIWQIDGPAIRFYGMPFPTRMVVVQLGKALWLHSPIAPEPELCERLAALGPVRWLVAPNNIHYAYFPAWADQFPEAQVYAAPGVAERAAGRGIAFPPHELLSDEAPPGWARVIDQRLMPGHPFLNEVVFFHRPSRTLILTDLIENFERQRLSWPMRLAARLAGILHPDGKAPVDMRLTWRDKPAARAVIDEVIGWGPEQVVMAHGRVYREDAVEELKRAFRWLG